MEGCTQKKLPFVMLPKETRRELQSAQRRKGPGLVCRKAKDAMVCVRVLKLDDSSGELVSSQKL